VSQGVDLLGLFDGEALRAVGPMLALAAGVLVLLLVGVVPALRQARGILVCATLLTTLVLVLGVLRRPPGPVLDGTFNADRIWALWGALFVCATLLAWLFSAHYYREDRPFQAEHDVLMLCTPIGMLLMAGAQDLIVFFIGLELLSIPLYALASFRRNRPRSVEAGVKYFLLGAFAAAFFLYGAALLYVDSGTVSLVELRTRTLESPLAVAGIALLTASLLFKVSVFPFHLWVPDVYQGSPTPVTALMATGTKAAAFAFLFNAAFLLPSSSAMTIAILALVTMAVGNLGALVQSDVKRMLAYSGIAHAGTVLLLVAGYVSGDAQSGYLAGSAQAINLHTASVHAALFYLAAYVFTAAGAFGLLALLEREGEEATTLDSLRGLAQRRPVVAAAMTLFMLSLGGIPFTGGFLGKYLVFSVAWQARLVTVAVIGALLSVVALGYYLRVVVAMYMHPPPAGAPAPRASTTAAALAAALCAAMVLAMGIAPRWFLDQF
jgi:NADH-quinone oxidoreductase subunit N